MIFSFSPNPSSLEIPLIPNTHIFCYFTSGATVKCVESEWYASVLASLKMKKNALILEAKIIEFPKFDDSKRIQVGQNWLWLAPRAHGVLSEAINVKSMSYSQAKSLLSTSN